MTAAHILEFSDSERPTIAGFLGYQSYFWKYTCEELGYADQYTYPDDLVQTARGYKDKSVPVGEFIVALDGYLAAIRSSHQSSASTGTQVRQSTMRARNTARLLLTGLRGDAGFYSSRALEAWEKNSTSPEALGMHATLKLRECALFKPEAGEIVNLGLKFLKGGAATGTADGRWMESPAARRHFERAFGESAMMFLFGMASVPSVQDHISEWLDHMPKSLQYLRPGVLAVCFWERDPADEARWCQEWKGAVAVSHLIRAIEKDKPAAADCGK